MNSYPRRQRLLMRFVFGMVSGILVVVCASSQSFSQSPVQSAPSEWTNLVAPPIPSSSPNANTSSSASSLGSNNPLRNLRQPDPSGLLTEDAPAEQVLGNTTYSSRQYRSEPTLAVGWSQPEFRHRQLYFQDDQIERGNAKRQFPNVTAGAKFFKSVFVFPVRLVTGK